MQATEFDRQFIPEKNVQKLFASGH